MLLLSGKIKGQKESLFNVVPRPGTSEICSLNRGFIILNTSIERTFGKTSKMFVISRCS